MSETGYFKIIDLNLVAKVENHVSYIYEKGRGWEVDNKHLLMDRMMGYNGETIGNSDELFLFDELTEEEAMQLINS